jgi:hypothetical protein
VIPFPVDELSAYRPFAGLGTVGRRKPARPRVDKLD